MCVHAVKSFEELYVVDGIRYLTYYTVCIARGLAENDQEWFSYFEKVIQSNTGYSLYTIFLISLRSNLISDPMTV